MILNNLIGGIRNREKSIVISPTDGAHKAFLISELFQSLNKTVVVIVNDNKRAVSFVNELNFFLPDREEQIVLFPGYNILPFKSLSYHRQTSTDRLAALSRIMESDSNPLIAVVLAQTLVQKIIPRDIIDAFSQIVMANEEIDRDELVENLEACGYIRTSLVEDPGEFSVRGDIIDLFSPGDEYPVRLEFFGDLVESMRYFNVYSQRGIRDLQETIVIPATEAVISSDSLPHVLARLRQAGSAVGLDKEKIRDYVNRIREFGRFPGIESLLPIVYDRLGSFFDYIPENTVFIKDMPDELAGSVKEFKEVAAANFQSARSEKRLCVEPDTLYLEWDSVEELVGTQKNVSLKSFHMGKDEDEVFQFEYEDNIELSSSLKREGRGEHHLQPLVDWCRSHTQDKNKVIFVLNQDSQAKRLVSLLQPYGIQPLLSESFLSCQAQEAGVYYLLGELTSGFTIRDRKLALAVENEIFTRKRIQRRAQARKDLKTRFITPEELKNGDIVVHLEHGIGRYEGLCSLKVGGIRQDFILILYQDNDKLYLPVDRIEMIGKYIGVDGYTPVLDKIGSNNWIKSKVKAKQEVEKLAADLLDLYAKRKVNNGFSFSRPDRYYDDFETAFEYKETRDQLKAIDDIHLDMESSMPMDRLICGDVGYGKTEVAMRAAFKAVNDGKQVAFVVPTTILAEQHTATFKERFGNYPVNIDSLSRFKTKKQQGDVLKQISKGTLDIVIGTHRLLQKDVAFNDLGLLIIDEEQRFGVRHKEMLKKKRSSVDVLALTATPIPRTLHMALTGMRDISVISTPPADRQPIVSYISEYDEGIVKDAVRKEIARKGQIFFVHNNIKSIFKVAENLEKLVPEARIGVAHGRLNESELEKVMLRFVNFDIDVLVCTTIVESGLDIPSANTMIINRAERFGLSQIYQLRGRIGRGDNQAFAYLFISDENQLTRDGKKRLAALMEHKDLGSGFQIAMKDLQIRGAGSALGASQSGHIAAVGYDMFLKLLDNAVKDLKGEDIIEPLEPEINVSISTGLPETYIESVEQRLTLYRRLSRLKNISDISDMKQEIIDRYGRMPKEAENMLLKVMLRIYCIQAGVKRLDINKNSIVAAFSLAHVKKSPDQLIAHITEQPGPTLVKKDTFKIDLGRNSSMSSAVLLARNILKALPRSEDTDSYQSMSLT